MKRIVLGLALSMMANVALAAPIVINAAADQTIGDSNADGSVSIVDPVFTLSHLYLSGPVFCLDAMDANDDGWVDVSDPVQQLATLFGASWAARAASKKSATASSEVRVTASCSERPSSSW